MSSEQDSARDVWSRKLTSAALTLAPPVNAEVLAEEFGRLDQDARDELCNEAAMQCIREGGDEVSLAHFQAAFEGVGATADQDVSDDEQDQDDREPAAAGAANVVDEPGADTDPEVEVDDHADDDQTDDVEQEPVQADLDTGDDADPDPATMARDELVAEVKQLRDEVDKLQEVANRDLAIMKGALVNFFDVDDIEGLPAAGNELREHMDDLSHEVAALDGAIADGGTEGKQSKVAQIVRLAANRRSDEPVIKLTPKDIVDATGVSERYAYKLADSENLPSEYDWILATDEIRQYGDLEIDSEKQSKAIAIDFDGVQGAACPLNKFNNGSE